MNQRQQKLFKNIVKEHIKSASPIGSRFLAEKYKMDVSPATVRNDMAKLEVEGLITHPHTSAGRVPTEAGFEYFVDNFLEKGIGLAEKEKQALDRVARAGKASGEERDRIKLLAKKVADLSDNAAVVAFAKNNVYYTGIANLFAKPEFVNIDLVCNMSLVIDRLDEVIEKIFETVGEIEIKIGKKNNFDENCASVLVKSGGVLFGVLGPIRMDYEKNLGMVNYVKKLLG